MVERVRQHYFCEQTLVPRLSGRLHRNRRTGQAGYAGLNIGLLLGFSGGKHTTWRKAASDAGCSDTKKFGVCLRVGGLAGVPGNGQNPLG